MNDNKVIEGTALACVAVSGATWQIWVSVICGILAGLYYGTRLYKEWFGGENKS